MPDPNPAPNHAPGQAAHRASEPAKTALQAYIDAFNRGDAAALVALFADDAVIEDPVGTPPKRGADLPAWFQQGVAMGARLELDAPIRGSHGNAAAMAFRVHMVQNGQALSIRSLDTVTVNAQGLITRLLGYWGPDDVEPGQDPSTPAE